MNIPSRFTFWRKDTTGTGTIDFLHSDVVARCVADSASAGLVRRWFFSNPGDFIEISIWARFVSGGVTGGQFRLDSISGEGHSVIKHIDLKTKSWRKYKISYQRDILGDSFGNVLSFAAGFNTVKNGTIDLREPEIKINGHQVVDNMTVMAGAVVFNSSGVPSFRYSSPTVDVKQVTWDSVGGRILVYPQPAKQYRARNGIIDNTRDIYPAIHTTVGANEPRTATRNPISVYPTMNYDVGTLSFYFYDAAALSITDPTKLKDLVIYFRVTA